MTHHFIGFEWEEKHLVRWNEKKIKELSMEEDDVKYRKRAGRLDKWKQLAREAADQRAQSTGQNITLPESIECRGA